MQDKMKKKKPHEMKISMRHYYFYKNKKKS